MNDHPAQENCHFSSSPRSTRKPGGGAHFQAALAYARKGKKVFPINPLGKAPLTAHGFKDATSDHEQIRSWWRRWPDANIGMPTGEESGVVVLDVDPRNGGTESFYELNEKYGRIPDTLRQKTGGQGSHFLFEYPNGTSIRTTTLNGHHGIDVKADGGYILLPPSKTKTRYAWVNPRVKPAPLPAWLLDLIVEKPKARAEPLPDIIPVGQRNTTLTSLAGSMRNRRCSAKAIFAALKEENKRCENPLSEDELRGIAKRIGRYPPGPAISWPKLGALPSIRKAAPTLPEKMVPEPLRAWLVDIAECACFPPLEFVVAIVGRSVGIKPSEFDDYLVVPNLWGGIIARPGAMKTYTVTEALKPVTRLAALAHEEYEATENLKDAHIDRIKSEIESIRGDMKKAAKTREGLDELEAELAEKKAELRQSEVYEKRYVTQDPTVEKIGELLRHNPRGLLLSRDELAGWLRTLEKSGREGDREFYLEAWNGTGSYTVDRIGRGTVRVDALCLSIVGGIQPGKLSPYIERAIRGDSGADGLLQRLQVTVWPGDLGEWKKPDSRPDGGARERAFQVFKTLDECAHQVP